MTRSQIRDTADSIARQHTSAAVDPPVAGDLILFENNTHLVIKVRSQLVYHNAWVVDDLALLLWSESGRRSSFRYVLYRHEVVQGRATVVQRPDDCRD